jgi:hypothetical protein
MLHLPANENRAGHLRRKTTHGVIQMPAGGGPRTCGIQGLVSEKKKACQTLGVWAPP